MESEDGCLRIAICEDDEHDASLLEGYIEGSDAAAAVSVFSSGEEFLASSPYGVYDLVFMDVYLGTTMGVEIARTL
ncbi:MAG: response regulator, partial [Synergistaceae bacterium]|nr:response regulator [Synergistaceae bacterium]